MIKGSDLSKYITEISLRYKYYLICMIALACLAAILNTSFGAMLKWLADGLEAGDPSVLMSFIILFSLQRLLLPLAGGGGALVSSMLANKIESDIRETWYEYVVYLDHDASKGKNSGEFQKKMQEAVNSVRILLNSTVRSTLSIFLEVISISFFAVMFIGVYAGLILLSFSFFYSVFVIYVTKRRLPVMKEIALSDGKCAAFMHDSFINSGIISPEVRASRSEQHQDLLLQLESKKNTNSKKLFIDSALSSIVCCVAALVILSVYYGENAFSVGTVVMLATSLAQMVFQINTLGFNYRNILRARVDLIRISEGLEPKKKEGTEKYIDIDFNNGCKFGFYNFMPNQKHHGNLKPISGEVIINAGEINILRGRSGVGKSTICRAMRGEANIGRGEVFLNDEDLNNFKKDMLLGNIGYVSQDAIIFNESILKNIKYGKEDASHNEVLEVLVKVGLDKFADRTDWVVGEKGGLLSGGERQRLVIARALLQRCDVIMLDEPFSGLDETSSSNMANLIAKLSKDICIFIVMHQRPEVVFSSIEMLNEYYISENSNNIIVEKRGKYA